MLTALLSGTNRGVVKNQFVGPEVIMLERTLVDHKVTSLAIQQNIVLAETIDGIYRIRKRCLRT